MHLLAWRLTAFRLLAFPGDFQYYLEFARSALLSEPMLS